MACAHAPSSWADAFGEICEGERNGTPQPTAIHWTFFDSPLSAKRTQRPHAPQRNSVARCVDRNCTIGRESRAIWEAMIVLAYRRTDAAGSFCFWGKAGADALTVQQPAC